MNFSLQGYFLLALLCIPVFLSIITFYYAYTRQRTKETLFKAFSIFLYILVLTILYGIGIHYQGTYSNDPTLIFLISLSAAMRSLAGIFNVDAVSSALQNRIYFVAFYVGSLGSLLFVIYSILALLLRKLANSFHLVMFRNSDVTMIYGDDAHLVSLLNSFHEDKNNMKTFFGIFNQHKKKIIILIDESRNKVDFAVQSNHIYLAEKWIHLDQINLYELFKPFQKHGIQLISVLDDDKLNLVILTHFLNVLLDKNLPLINFQSIHFYLPMNDMHHMSLFSSHPHFDSCVHLYSYHEMIAFNMMMNKPIDIDLHTSNHYIFIGFGSTNQLLYRGFLSSHAIDPMMKYTIVTNDDYNNLDLFLNGVYYQQDHYPSGEYLIQPNIDALFKNTDELTLDVHKNSFCEKLFKNIHSEEHVVVFVAVGDDVKNMMTAQLINNFIFYKTDIKCYEIMTKITGHELQLTPSKISDRGYIKSFGDLTQVYTYQNIVKEAYSYLAKAIHETLYDEPWNKLSHYEKHSSLLAVTSIRNKLRYLGLDLVEEEGIDEKSYYAIYEPDKSRLSWKRLDMLQGFDRYLEDSKRNRLAQFEHDRWNYYVILNGFVPMSIHQLKEQLNEGKPGNPAKDLMNKRHACITTFEGLYELAKIIDDDNHKTQKQNRIDYILADYMVMDHLPDILKNSPYKIGIPPKK